MGTRQIRTFRVAAAIALTIGCVWYAPLAADEGAQLVGISVDESAAGITRIRLDVEPMTSWSSYRGADGALTLELANTQPATGLELPAVSGSAVEAIEVNTDTDRQMTMVHIVDREAEHEITPSASGLEIVVRSLGVTEAASMADPVEAEPALMEEIDPAPATVASAASAAVQPQGTVDQPFEGDTPEGLAATQVLEVEASTENGETSVLIRGDGAFPYSAFSLGDPDRFVLDLRGVLVGVADPRIRVDSDTSVKQVRLGQYQDDPQPVARVVFDLDSPAVPWVQPTADGLMIRFGAQPEQVAVVPAAEEFIEEAEPMMETAEVADASAESSVAEVAAPAVAAAAVADAVMLEEMSDVVPSADSETVETAMDGVAVEAAATELVAEEMNVELDAVEETAAVDVIAATEASTDDYMEEAIEEVEEVAEAAEVIEADELVESEMFAEPVPEPVSAATEAAYYNEQDLTVTTGDAEGEPNQAAGFEAREVVTDSRFSGEPIDLSLQDTDVRDVLRSLAQISGLNLVIQPSVAGTVTVEFVQVPWDQALEQILKINNLGYEVEGNIMRVAPLSQLREEAEQRQRLAAARAAAVPLTTVLQRVSYATASEIARILSVRGGIMSQRGTVVVDERTNTLIIKELPAYIDTVLSVIENLDVAEPQVMIEARIIETTKRFTRTLGVQWGFSGVADAEHGNTTGLEFPNNVRADGGVNLLTGGNNGFLDLTLGNVLNTFTLDVALQAAENEGLINVLSEPRVATLNNERATIQSGLQIPIQTVANNTVSVQFVNATLRLDVTPQVTADGTVLMDIRIQKREPQISFAVPGAANAPISTKEASTRVIVRDGGTTVIGGIYEVSTDDGEDRVPGLGEVKGIGALFRNKRRNDENEELLIFITPKVIRL